MRTLPTYAGFRAWIALVLSVVMAEFAQPQLDVIDQIQWRYEVIRSLSMNFD